MRKVVGLDISLKKIAVCVLDRDGQLVWQGKVDAEPGPLVEKLRLWRDEIDLVGLQACPLSPCVRQVAAYIGSGPLGLCFDQVPRILNAMKAAV